MRDGTFLARKDEHLLNDSTELPWPRLEEFRCNFRNARERGERPRDVSLHLEATLRQPDAQAFLLGRLQDELRRLGPPGSYRRLERFFPKYFTHRAGPAAGQPFKLEKFQRSFLREWSSRDGRGERIYTVSILGISKGNGKTPIISGLGTLAVAEHTDAPEVYSVAGSADQAGICHKFASDNISDSALAAWLEVVGDTIFCPEHDGEFTVLSSAGDLAHGIKPTLFLFDELWLAIHRAQREAYHAGAQALHKRPGEGALLAISTAGYDRTSLLGEIYDAALAHPLLEVREKGPGPLYRVRDEETGFLFEWWGAPEDADIENPAVIRKANPLSVVRPEDLLRELNRSDTEELAWRRLHCNQWTKTKNTWKASGVWRRLQGDLQIPEGAAITVGVDCARSYDTTSVGWAWLSPAGVAVTRAHIWSVRRNVPHHEFVEGGELVNEDLVEPFIEMLASRYRVCEIAFDPRYFSAEARHLSNDGFTLVEVQPQSAAMGDAVTDFEKAALSHKITHDGDLAVAAHFEAVDQIRDARGSTKIGKRSDAYPIDAAIATILAHYRLLRYQEDAAAEPWAASW